MKIVLKYDKYSKLFSVDSSKPNNFQNMMTFIMNNFTNLPSKIVVKYLDSEGDLIVLGSNKDIEMLLESKKQYHRANIEEDKESDEQSEESGSQKSGYSGNEDNHEEDISHQLVSDEDESDYHDMNNKNEFHKSNLVLFQNQLSQNSEKLEKSFMSQPNPPKQQPKLPATLPVQQNQIFSLKKKQAVLLPLNQDKNQKYIKKIQEPYLQESPFSKFSQADQGQKERLYNTLIKGSQKASKIIQTVQQTQKNLQSYINTSIENNKQNSAQVVKQKPVQEAKQNSFQYLKNPIQSDKQSGKQSGKQNISQNQNDDSSWAKKQNTKILQSSTNPFEVFQPQKNEFIVKLVHEIFQSKFDKEFDAKFDKKLQSGLTKLGQKIKKQILENLSQSSLSNSKPDKIAKPKHIHELQCSECQAQRIQGVRYKCPQCWEYNLCETCEQSCGHEHNLLKMRIPEQHNNTLNDQRIILTKKCFHLASYFGGDPGEYIKFVEHNLIENNNQLVQNYLKFNKDALKKRIGHTIQQMAKMLGFYFDTNYINYFEKIRQHPNQGLQSLIELIKKAQGEKTLNLKVKSQEKREVFDQKKKKKFMQEIFQIYGINPELKNIETKHRIKLISQYYNDNWDPQDQINLVANFCKTVQNKNALKWKRKLKN